MNLPGLLGGIPGEWVKDAACGLDDADMFFGGTGRGHTVGFLDEIAKKVCRKCRVRDECLAWVLEDDAKRIARRESTNRGVWGATTQQERNALRKGRAS